MTTNRGIETEAQHFTILQATFGDLVSAPRGMANGSDFVVTLESGPVTFESKTSNTDLYDCGCLGIWANGGINKISSFVTDAQQAHISELLAPHTDAVADYLQFVEADQLPHVTTKVRFNEAKAAGKLVYVTGAPPADIVEASLARPVGDTLKAHYVVVDDLVYRSSAADPLGLGATILHHDDIYKFEVRTGRGGSRGPDKRVCVSTRMGFKFHRTMPGTDIRLSDLPRMTLSK